MSVLRPQGQGGLRKVRGGSVLSLDMALCLTWSWMGSWVGKWRNT